MRGALGRVFARRTAATVGRRAASNTTMRNNAERGADSGADFPDAPPEPQKSKSSGGRRRGGGGGLAGPMIVFSIFLASAIALWAIAAFAVQPEEVLDDPVLEERAREISKGLRCVVCQNESIDESNADIAASMRILVRERLVAGDSDDQVRQALVDAYGEFVLLMPRFSVANAMIWLAPFIALGIGAAWYLRRTGRMAAAPDEAATTGPTRTQPLTAEEQARLNELLKG